MYNIKKNIIDIGWLILTALNGIKYQHLQHFFNRLKWQAEKKIIYDVFFSKLMRFVLRKKEKRRRNCMFLALS